MTAPSPPRPAAGAPRLRSVLFTPGDRGDRIAKALQEGAQDLLVADLEDAVASDRKAVARAEIVRAFAAVPARPGHLRGIRINPWPSAAATADLAAVVRARPDVLAVPKCESAEALRAFEAQLAKEERHAGLPPGAIRVLVVLETAAGVMAARELASFSPRVLGVCFGAEDLAADAGLVRGTDNWEVQVPRALVALAAASCRVAAIDMITAEARDLERTALEATQARRLGYAGKMCIHPLQVVAVHEAFRPSAEQVAWAGKVMAEVERTGIASGGVVSVDGRMVDVPFIEQARRILAEAEGGRDGTLRADN